MEIELEKGLTEKKGGRERIRKVRGAEMERRLRPEKDGRGREGGRERHLDAFKERYMTRIDFPLWTLHIHLKPLNN